MMNAIPLVSNNNFLIARVGYSWSVANMHKIRICKKLVGYSLLIFIFKLLGMSLTVSASEPVKSMKVGVNLQVRAYLQGPYDAATGLMRDRLRTRGLLPLQQPYGSSPFNYQGTEALNRSLSSVSLGGDADALVDWLLVELRSATNPSLILAQKAVGLQADGDAMDVETGSTQLAFLNVTAGNYYVAVRHRNHLGVMTATASALSFTSSLFDFSQPTFAVTGQHSRVLNKTKALLWAGDINQDKQVIAQGIGSDSTALIATVLSASGNTAMNTSYRLVAYAATDVNLDGETLAVGPNNDINLLLTNVLAHPANTTLASNYIVRGYAY